MKKKLEMLEQLQNIDHGIDAQKAEQAMYQKDIAELEVALAALRQMLSEQQGRMTEMRHEKSELDVALHTEQENIRRSETNMKEIRTNKEFQAVGREITAARKQIGEIEEQQLQLIGRMEELQAAIDLQQQDLTNLEETTATGIAGKQAAIAQLQTAIDAAQANRDSLVKGLGSSLIRRYTQLREQRRGQALAIARDGSCLGCNMHLPPQMYNMLFKGEEMFFCPHCQRILILKQDQVAAQ